MIWWSVQYTSLCFCVEYIQPICLPAYGQRLIDGQMGTVTGWGNVGYYGESTSTSNFTVLIFKSINAPNKYMGIVSIKRTENGWDLNSSTQETHLFPITVFDGHSQVIWQMFSRKQTSPSSVMPSVMLQITTTTRSPPACSVLATRKEALMPVRSECACVYALCVWLSDKVHFSYAVRLCSE